jgi:hypothetical protein
MKTNRAPDQYQASITLADGTTVDNEITASIAAGQLLASEGHGTEAVSEEYGVYLVDLNESEIAAVEATGTFTFARSGCDYKITVEL